MTIIKRSAIVAYQPAEMYELVNHIESYPQFVPWCVSSVVLSRNEDEIRATLSFARGGLQKSFTTCNRLQPHKLIEIRLLDGPFRHLEGFWRFESHASGGTEVCLDLEFEFSNKLLELAFGPIFNQVANKLVEVFCKRAEEVYGNKNAG